MVGKYLDGLPLYRQSAILAREGIAIERATPIGSGMSPGGGAARRIYVLAAPVIHTDDMPIAVLAPGNSKTRTGRLWTYIAGREHWRPITVSVGSQGRATARSLAAFRGVIQRL